MVIERGMYVHENHNDSVRTCSYIFADAHGLSSFLRQQERGAKAHVIEGHVENDDLRNRRPAEALQGGHQR